MGAFLASRRRSLSAKGRPMTLSRPNGSAPAVGVVVQGFVYTATPEPSASPASQDIGMAAILNDEIVAAAWPGPPKKGDWLQVDGVTWQVVGNALVYEGAVLIGHTLTIKGGKP